MSKAFGSSSWEAMGRAISAIVQSEHVALCKNRYRDAVVLLPRDEGDLAVKTGVGGMMGDPFVVAAFSTTFCRPVLKWADAAREVDPPLRPLRAEWGGQEVDLSLCKYADDLVSLHMETPWG
eukprot:2273125-Pyramimonas_sp.AAC.1